MSPTKSLFLIVFFSLLFKFSTAQTAVKASYWFPESEFPVTEIDSSLFTHLFCAFANLNSQTNQITVSDEFSNFTQIVQRRNPSVQTLLSIGGGNANQTAFASMASNSDSRKSFIDSTIRFARLYGFHGLDLDWQYPSDETAMSNFGTLIEEWRLAVVAESNNTGQPRLLLAAAVFYSSDYYSVLYPVQVIANSLDWVNLMAYDFYGPGWSNLTGPSAALHDPSTAGPNSDAGVRAWTEAGLPANKAVLGLPYYGYAWRLSNANNNSYYAATTAAAISSDGSIRYDEIKKFIVDNEATTVHNSTVVGDYCYTNDIWIGYDDTQSIVTKVRYAKYRGLLGYYSWHIGADDNSGLSRAASRAWDGTTATTGFAIGDGIVQLIS